MNASDWPPGPGEGTEVSDRDVARDEDEDEAEDEAEGDAEFLAARVADAFPVGACPAGLDFDACDGTPPGFATLRF